MTDNMNRQTGFMVVLIAGLSVACIGLIVALALRSETHPDKPVSEYGSVAEPEPESEGNDEWTLSDDEDNEVEYTFPWEKEVRLPRSVVPIHYDVYLHPNLQEGTFYGKVDVLVQNGEPRDHFLIHTKYLTIQDASVSRGTEKVDLMEVMEYKRNEFLVMRAHKDMAPGNYTLSVSFNGNLTKGIVGFYKSVYTNAQGVKVPIATSKFQPTFARQAFPCFDEPSFKSTFAVTLVRPTDGYIALSNMPVERERKDEPTQGFTEVKFEKSVPMVTYLACFIVCDFEFQEKLTSRHQTKFRVYATPLQRDRVKYALDIGANITDYFEDYFQIPYPLPKQDMIAIPDFVSGAMEHWGLITYRETNLLFDERESSSSNQQRVATVISHELAHQWFGNLVTLSWWDDLWLNEGFASYVEYKGVTNYHPDWDMEGQFLIKDLHRVMDLDATINSHPIVQPVDHPDQITEIFDTISYAKGASVLRMLEGFMGSEEFKLGISRFLKRFQYQNAVTQDLWTELSKVSSLNITKIMDTWTRQMGYPVLQIEKVKPTVYRIIQERYLTDPASSSKSANSPYGYRWEVPVTYITSTDPKNIQQKWLGAKEGYMELNIPPGVKWVKFNKGQTGYYRVNYPIEDWNAFGELLKEDPNTLDSTDRASLLNDAFSLAESGHLDYSIPMAMTQYLRKEKSYVPWNAVIDKLYRMHELMVNTDAYPALRKYLLTLVSDHYERLGWKDEGTHTERLNRVNIIGLACLVGHVGCLEEAGRLFNDWIEDDKVYIAPNIRRSVYKYGMMYKGNSRSWNIMFDRFMREDNAQEKKKLQYGLSWIKEPWILQQYIEMSKNESVVRSQDFLTGLRYIQWNPVGTPIVWDFIRREWPYLVARYTLNDRYLGRMPKYIAPFFSSQFKLDEMKAFFAKYPDAGAGERSRKQALETILNNISWLERHKNVIHSWLQRQ